MIVSFSLQLQLKKYFVLKFQFEVEMQTFSETNVNHYEASRSFNKDMPSSTGTMPHDNGLRHHFSESRDFYSQPLAR
jgi:hypothetical protein